MSNKETITIRGKLWEVLAKVTHENAFPVVLGRHSATLMVQYGAEFHTFDVQDNEEALREFGSCVRHALECAGELDEEV